jgi:Flp pilus assembly protein protease CpaA
MIEEVLFGKLAMPGEAIRLLVAFAGVALASYYDLFNRRNVPNMLLYGFLAAAFIVNLAFFQQDLFVFSIALAVFFSAIGYMFYRFGQLGGADVFIIASVILLLPIHPSFSGLAFNLPYIFSVMVFAGIAFAIYVVCYFGLKLREVNAHPKRMYALLLIPYLLFAFVYVNSVIFSPMYFVFVSILMLATMFFMAYKEDINLLLAERMSPAELEEEDVLALEMMDQEAVKKYRLKRLATKSEIERMAGLKIQEVWVYSKMPPFLPFFLLGMVLALFFANSLLAI